MRLAQLPQAEAPGPAMNDFPPQSVSVDPLRIARTCAFHGPKADAEDRSLRGRHARLNSFVNKQCTSDRDIVNLDKHAELVVLVFFYNVFGR